MISQFRSSFRCVAILFILSVQSVSAAFISHTVDGRDNLYNTDWTGNPFPDAIGTGIDARVVEDPVGTAFNFTGGMLKLAAAGLVTDDGISDTDADGLPNSFQDGMWRDLPVYALIGIWSSSSTEIAPLGDPFFIGTQLDFDSPDSSEAFLFLAENDGIFNDNFGEYDVFIDFSVNEVPLPAAVWVFIWGILGVGIVARRKS